VIVDLLFQLILDLIPKKIRNIFGIFMIIIGILLSIIAIPLWLVAGHTDLGLISAILAIPIVICFLFGFVLITSTEDGGLVY
tara:strand:- start:711 stop:956 length:246 start_codon:yes stop_codon:yes gene_type:complete